MYVSAELIIAAIKQASINPTSPRFSGPRISLAAMPQTRSGSAAISGLPASKAKAINAVIAQPIVHSRFRKLPTTKPMRASSSLFAEPPPVAMKCGWTTMPTNASTVNEMMYCGGNSPGTGPGEQTEIIGRDTLVHDLESVHDALRLRIAELLHQRPQSIRNQQHTEQNDEDPLNQVGPISGRQPTQHSVSNHDAGQSRNQHVLQFDTPI